MNSKFSFRKLVNKLIKYETYSSLVRFFHQTYLVTNCEGQTRHKGVISLPPHIGFSCLSARQIWFKKIYTNIPILRCEPADEFSVKFAPWLLIKLHPSVSVSHICAFLSVLCVYMCILLHSGVIVILFCGFLVRS